MRRRAEDRGDFVRELRDGEGGARVAGVLRRRAQPADPDADDGDAAAGLQLPEDGGDEDQEHTRPAGGVAAKPVRRLPLLPPQRQHRLRHVRVHISH